MMFRAKAGLQNTKPIVGYSPMHSPSNRKKTSVLKQNKFSPKPSHRENKQNIQQKQIKTERGKQQKYFKISKQQPHSSSKKQKANSKICISISINDKNKNIEQLNDLNFLNIQTPKFKCSSNKVDDRLKTDYLDQDQNYFSFGDQFRQNLNTKIQSANLMNFNRQKAINISISPLKQRNKNILQQNSSVQKFSINSLKKRDKADKIKQSQQKLELRFLQIEKQMKDNKFKKDREIFCFKK